MNYNRLKKARLYRGITTVEELAKKIGITKQALSKYETNKSDMPYKQILEISNVLDFPYKYFIQDDDNILKIEPKSVYFRSLMKTNKKYREQQVIKMDFISYIYSVLSKYINFPKLNLPKLNDNETPKKAAQKLREHWGLANEPIQDLVRVLEKYGLIVTQFETETDDIDAFSQMFGIEDKNIFIVALSNNKSSASRVHFDIAHELGHILLHEWNEDNELLSKEQFKEREKEANEFASEFLLPYQEFTNDVSKYPTQLNYYIELKKKWRTSIAAMVYRANQLNIITQSQYLYLVRNMNTKGWRSNEPLDDTLKTAEPSLLNTAIDMLLDNNIFTVKQLLKEIEDNGLAMNSKDIEMLLHLPKNKLEVKEIHNAIDIKDILNIKTV